MWGKRYPRAVYRLVTSTPEEVEAIGGDELLYPDGKRRGGAYAAIRTRRPRFAFAVVGSLTDAKAAEALAAKYAKGGRRRRPAGSLGPRLAQDHPRRSPQERHRRSQGGRHDFPLARARRDDPSHRAARPRAIFGRGLGHARRLPRPAGTAPLARARRAGQRRSLRIVFAQQYEKRGDWPQWFMLEPYSAIQDKEAHGDIIVWPLKALCDYVEATGDFAFLDEPIAWRREDDFETTSRRDPVAAHVAKLIATVRERFIPGTHLVRYGNGDWNDSLQPVDPAMRDWMASSWTVALLHQQLRRYAEILRLRPRRRRRRPRRARRGDEEGLQSLSHPRRRRRRLRRVQARGRPAETAASSERRTHRRLLLPDPDDAGDPRRAVHAGAGAAPSRVIRKHLLFPDGAQLMDKPLAYRGGTETIFRRAELAAFFGREIGLMYVHAHLRYAEAMSVLGEREALWDALLVANPIAVTDRFANASLRQRNAYFSSSDAAFRDRYEASAQWERVKTGGVAVDGGWRIYSSGPGLYVTILIQEAFGFRRRFGKRIAKPRLPEAERGLSLSGISAARRQAAAPGSRVPSPRSLR